MQGNIHHSQLRFRTSCLASIEGQVPGQTVGAERHGEHVRVMLLVPLVDDHPAYDSFVLAGGAVVLFALSLQAS